jgi:DNA-binding SARP family transcriptional activator
MPGMPLRPIVDTPFAASVSFAPAAGSISVTPDRAPLAVGPGRPTGMTSRSLVVPADPDGYDVQLAKVQRPVLRDETLERPRLLDRLRAKIHSRVVLLLADAGYGKTTLLADFSRRTRLRTLWYRLDETDRDWTSFLRHLVAAGREHDPDFAPATTSLLREIGVTGPSREAVLDTFLRELPSITGQGAALIFDDFHLVDDAVDVRHITRELLARGPERLTLVIASRRAPAVQLSRLRAVGEVVEIDTDALRFDAAETAQLFNETYGRNLEADVLLDLAQRTEGWIASLQLVHAALRDRSPAEIRRFVRTLNGADHDMYDYLAEEVVGDLPEELQRFLMDTSILQVVTPELAEIVSGRDASAVARLTTTAERLTLLSRLSGGPRTHQRYHPLVREFLEARFRSIDGEAKVAELHRRTAAAVEASDWRVAAHHYRQAGDTADMLGTISRAIPTIMGNGQYALAESFIGPIAAEDRPPGFDLILSRVEMQQGDYDAAIAASQAVLDSATDPIQRDYALLNLLTMSLNFGKGEDALRYAAGLLESEDDGLREIAGVSRDMVVSAVDGPLGPVRRQLRQMASRQRADRKHFYAVTQHNLAAICVVEDDLPAAAEAIGSAIEVLEAGAAPMELQASIVIRALVQTMLGNVEEATRTVASLLRSRDMPILDEVLIESADLLDSYLDPVRAMALLVPLLEKDQLTNEERRLRALALAKWHIRRDNMSQAEAALADYPASRSTTPGALASRLFVEAYLATRSHAPNALELASRAEIHAQRQGAQRWRRYSTVLRAANQDATAFSDAIWSVGEESSHSLAFMADLISTRLTDLEPPALATTQVSAEGFSGRWRFALRREIEGAYSANQIAAGQLLEQIGERSDVKSLRAIARQSKRRPDVVNLGRRLSRRLADRVVVEDQGRVHIRIGERLVPGSDVRRKVLAMLCFLVSRPGMSSTRDQVLDAMWPELDPEVAVNSLNQTIYFLRRVVEPDYVEDLSPGYFHHDSELVWLDSELIRSQSATTKELIRSLPPQPSPDEVDRLVSAYTGRFALDFEYEEWAGAYRDSLHASYLEVVERSVADDFRAGHFDRGIAVARRALDIDSTAENLEVSLLRLYKATGAHAAAAEQYAHYSSVLRHELGIEPPTLESL